MGLEWEVEWHKANQSMISENVGAFLEAGKSGQILNGQNPKEANSI